MSKTKLTTNNINAAITEVAKGARNTRDEIQRILDFAVKYAIDNRNPLYLTTLRDALEKRTGISTRKIHGYIMSAVSGLTYAENKNGKMVYKPKGGDTAIERTETVKCWVDWKPADHVAPEYTMDKFIKMIESKAAPKEGVNIAADVQEMAKTILASINEVAKAA